MAKKNIINFATMKRKSEQVVWITAYDYLMGAYAEQAGMDMILVGDSLGMVALGYQGTNPVTMEDCISRCKAVKRGAPNTWIVGDMPFLSYQISDEDAVANAGRFIKEAEMDCIKLEGGVRVETRIRAITNAGIPVMGHIGLTPQSSGQLGGFRSQGRDAASARFIIEDALAVERAGAFSILLEAIPQEVTTFIQKRLSIPVYSIGAGLCDGQLMICADLLGMFQAFTPKFVKKYAAIGDDIINAFKEYVEDVRSCQFPTMDYTYLISDPVEKFEEMFKDYEK